MLILLCSFLGGSLVCRDSFVFFWCEFDFSRGELKGENIRILHRHIFIDLNRLRTLASNSRSTRIARCTFSGLGLFAIALVLSFSPLAMLGLSGAYYTIGGFT